jgi:predicted ester cyclase
VTRWTATGTHLGDFRDIAPTGRQVTVSGVHIDRVDGDKIAERWEQFDLAGMLQQLAAKD